jgi:RNA polymerase sigma factor (sigma-70 family)
VPLDPGISEIELVNQCIQQDRTAQRNLFEKYKKAMFNTSYRILNDHDHANDALQEAFVEVFRDLKNFRMESTLGAWIKTIVVRKSILKFKSEQRFEIYDQRQHDQGIEWPSDLTGEYLDKAIRSLPIGYRTVFTLIEIEGYSHKEVAEILNISEGTSKSQLYHSKKLLQEKLKDIYRS